MDRYTFPGYPAFLARASEELGLASGPAGSSAGLLGPMANLCGQASTAEPAHVPQILAEAAGFRDRLLVTARAAELMLTEVARARSDDGAEESPAPLPTDRHEGPARPRPARPSSRPSSHRP